MNKIISKRACRMLAAWGALALAAGARADVQPIEVKTPSRTTPVSFTREIQPFLEDRCIGCHSSALAEHRLNMETVAGMKKGGKRGSAIRAGKGDDSLILKMAARRMTPAMPPVDKPANRPLEPGQLGLLKLWIDQGAHDDSPETPEPAAALELHEPPSEISTINAIDLTADGTRLAIGRSNKVRILDVNSGLEIITLDGGKDLVQSLRYSPDATMLAVGGYQTVTLWSVPRAADSGSWSVTRTLGAHRFRVLALDFSPDGKLLATGGGEPSASGEVMVWEVGKGLLARRLESLHSDTILGLRFSPDGTKLATAAADKFVKVVTLKDGKLARSFEGHTHHVMGVDWEADGKRLVSAGADGVLKLWDYESGDQIRTLNGPKKSVTAVRWLAGKPEIVATSGDGQTRGWNPDNPAPKRTFAGPQDYVLCLAVSADGARVAAGCSDGSLHVWDGATGRVLRAIKP